MADHLITCITKPDRFSAHEGITHLGGPGWGKMTRQAVVEAINNGHAFYTTQNGARVNVGVVNGANGPYVRTYANGVWTDNLLSLPEC